MRNTVAIEGRGEGVGGEDMEHGSMERIRRMIPHIMCYLKTIDLKRHARERYTLQKNALEIYFSQPTVTRTK